MSNKLGAGKKKIGTVLGILVFLVLVSSIPNTRKTAEASASYVGKVSTGGSNLNVRKGPSTNYAVITTLKNGSTVTVLETTGDWYQIRLASGTEGFVIARCLKVSTASTGSSYPVTAKVTAGGVPLKLRRSASTSSSILAEIPRGSSITILGRYSSEWYRARYNGKEGYVYASYIVMPSGFNNGSSPGSHSGSTSTGNSSGSKNTYKAVSMPIETYLQQDSRWSGTKLGSSNRTISQQGCVVCGIAEMESYLYGRITPDRMAKKLSFDSAGQVIWDSKYTIYNGSDYLSRIYSQLENGNPVLVGSKKSNNRQHWVVVSGCKGGSKLKSSMFTIADCSGHYSTLDQFLEDYPYFYKIVYE